MSLKFSLITASFLLSFSLTSLEAKSFHVESYSPNIEAEVHSPNLKLKSRRQEISSSNLSKELSLFDVSCDGLKYTGAVETVAINYLTQTKEAVTKMVIPYFSLSSFEAAIFASAFVDCLVTVSNEQTKGSSTSSSALESILYAIGNIGKSGVKVLTGATVTSDNTLGGEVETKSYIDIGGSLYGFIKKKINEGWFNDIMECTQRKRVDIYTKLYEILNQQFTLKLNNEIATFNQCNIQLIQEDEKVPSWNALFGNKLAELTDSSLSDLNSNSLYNKKIGLDDYCKPGDQNCKTPENSGCKIGEPNCKPFSSEEVIEKNVLIGDHVEAFSASAKADLKNLYPEAEGYSITMNPDGSYRVEQKQVAIGGGTYASKMPMIKALRESWQLEQEGLETKEKQEDTLNANEELVSPSNTNPYNECKNGISSIGDSNCLTYENARDRNKLLTLKAPKTNSDFISLTTLTNLEQLTWEIFHKNPKGFKNTFEYVYDKLKLISYKYTISFKNTDSGKEELNHVNNLNLLFTGNFNLNISSDTRIKDIRNIFLQNKSGNIKILSSPEFSQLLLRKLVEDVTGKTIPLDKTIEDQQLDMILKIFLLHKNYFTRYIDLSSILNKNIQALDGSMIHIDIYDNDINNILENLNLWYLNQRKALKLMFDTSTTVFPTAKQDGIPIVNQNTHIGLTYFVQTLPSTDYRQELITRVNRDILEYKLLGNEKIINDIYFFYKLFLYWNPTSFQDKMSNVEKILNNTSLASDKEKKANLMHNTVLENNLLEKARIYNLIEKYIDKKE